MTHLLVIGGGFKFLQLKRICVSNLSIKLFYMNIPQFQFSPLANLRIFIHVSAYFENDCAFFILLHAFFL